MNQFAKLIVLVGLLAVAACRRAPEVIPTIAPTTELAPTETAPAATPTEVSPTEIPTLVPTAAPAETPTPEPTSAPPGLCDLVDASQIELDMQGLLTEWQAECVPENPFGQDGPMFTGLPEHIQINFDGRAPETRQPFEPVIYIIPAQAYSDMWDEAGNPIVRQQLDALANWILRRPTAVQTQQMPVLPLAEAQATNDLAVQGRYVDLEAGDGIRFVGRFAQGPAPVTNEGLRYIFQGFAGENDELFIAFFYPVRSPHLPATAEEVTADELSAFENNPGGAINLAAVELNGLTAADWRPALDVLDDFIRSLHYGGTETGEEVPEIDGGDGQPASYAIVSAASGVNVRGGPSTAFPIIGLAPFGAQLELSGRSRDGQWWTTPAQDGAGNLGWVSAPFVDAFNAESLPVISAPLPPATPTPAPPVAEPVIAFWADRTRITQGECATLRWSVENIQAVWVHPQGQNFENFPVTGDGSRQVCPSQTTTFEMRVQMQDGSVSTHPLPINVNPGNPLANTRWVLSSFGESQPILGNPPTMAFGNGNYVDGFGGCNTFWGNYSVFEGGGLAISVATRSLVTCEATVTAQETRYMQALQNTGSYEISQDILILRDTGGLETLRFLRQ